MPHLQSKDILYCGANGPASRHMKSCSVFQENLIVWNLKIYRCHYRILSLDTMSQFNPLNPELNPICYLLTLLGHHFLHVSRIRVKSLTLRLLMSYIYIYIYIYRAPILDVSRSYTTTHHSR